VAHARHPPPSTDASLADAELYRRGSATLLATWEEYARGADAARLLRLPGVATAVFPGEPERSVYNNALLEPRLSAAELTDALDATETAYAAAGIARFAAWVHESDETSRRALEQRGYTLDETTRAMGMSLADLRLPKPEIDLGAPSWADALRTFELSPDLLRNADHSLFHLLVTRADDETVATALAFDWDSDCGIFNVGTIERARRHGLGTALTVLQLHNAVVRGCRTASLQATKIAQGMYAAVGFRDLGLIREYVPDTGR
jgi:hypothetical protein